MLKQIKVIDWSAFSNVYNVKDFVEYFKKIKNCKIIYWYALEFSGPPFNMFPDLMDESNIIDLINVLKQNNLELFVIYGGVEGCDFYRRFDNIENIKFLYWPTYLLHYSKHYMEMVYKKPIKKIRINKNFDKLFLNLNYKAKEHRGMMVDSLYKNGLLDLGIFSWNELTNDMWSNRFKFTHWDEKIVNYDVEYVENINNHVAFHTDSILNNGCFINLVGETVQNNNMWFITEKTYKNFLIGQPFISFGSIHQNKILKSFGFKLYDEIIDYGFDDSPILNERIEGVVENMVRLKSMDYNELYLKIQHKVEFNRNKALDIINDDPYMPIELFDLYEENPNKFLSEAVIPEYIKKIFITNEAIRFY